jgi:cell division protein FtsB
MFEKLKRYQNHPWVNQLKDVRVLGLLAFVVIVVLVSWSGVNVIQTNFNLEKQVSKLQQQNQVAQLENNNLKLQNEYYNTDTYVELTARKQFGKGAPGETEVIIPKSVALAHTVALPELGQKSTAKAVPAKSTYQQNFEAWMNFFLHRQNVDDQPAGAAL